jgi:DNA repair protein RecO (recombination protein O)
MLVTTDALVLRIRKQGDSSKICGLYTREFGLVNVLAKGARQMRSPFAGALELFASLKVSFYKKSSTHLYLLAKAETDRSMRGISDSLERIEDASRIASLLLSILHDEEKDEPLFELLLRTMSDIAVGSAHLSVVHTAKFYFQLARTHGMEITIDDTDARSYVFDTDAGAIYARNGDGLSQVFVPMSAQAVAMLRNIDDITFSSPSAAREIITGFERYFQRHLTVYSRKFAPIR